MLPVTRVIDVSPVHARVDEAARIAGRIPVAIAQKSGSPVMPGNDIKNAFRAARRIGRRLTQQRSPPCRRSRTTAFNSQGHQVIILARHMPADASLRLEEGGVPPAGGRDCDRLVQYGSIASWGLTPVASLAVDVPVGRWLLPFGPVS